MSLRRKILLVVILTLISLIGLPYLISRALLLESFTRLETQSTRQHVRRALNALGDNLEALNAIATDWAWWDDTYAFIADPDEAYIRSNLVDETFVGLRVNLILFLDTAGELVFGKAYDLRHGQQVPIPAGIQTLITDGNLLPGGEDAREVRSGFVALPQGPMMISATAILNSEEDLPSRGTMVWGRYLDALELQRLADTTRLSLTLHPFYAPRIPEDFQVARAALSEASPVFIRPLDEETVAGYALLSDISGNPALILRVDLPRDIYEQGQAAISSVILTVLVVGLVFSAVALILLQRIVVTRLLRLTGEVQRIGVRGDPSARVTVQGNDELATLASTINAMLEALERSQAELQRAHDGLARAANLAAAGEIAAGVAHQINNPLTAIAADAHLMLKRTPTGSPDHESATAIQEAARRAGRVVQQLLDLTRTIPIPMHQVDVNQSLQNAIALVRSQVEPVARLSVELAPDLPPVRASGQHLEDVVWINLLLNARDAVRGRSGGHIRVRTAYNAERKLIEVVIEDNGVGIPQENLPRVFEPFFTTKPQGTGLGLSICQDVVERHGGSIQVQSQPGQGTRFLVRLPARP